MDSWHLPNLSVQIAPDCISEYLNFQNFLGGMPSKTPPSKSQLRRSKWALSRPYCHYSELCHARAYKQKMARNAPDNNHQDPADDPRLSEFDTACAILSYRYGTAKPWKLVYFLQKQWKG